MATENYSQKEAFLNYLQHMDVDMMDLILDDSYTYFGASKKVFIAKLSFIFNRYISAGGSSYLEIKQHKKHKNWYSLLMPLFNKSYRFIIEESDGEIKNINSSKKSRSRNAIEGLTLLDLVFGDDEKADFIASTDYKMSVYNCNSAYAELISEEIKILTSKDVSDWLFNHSSLYKEVKDKYLFFRFNDFRILYLVLENIFDQLQYYNVVKKALASFNSSDSASIQQWLADYDRLYFCKLFPFGYDFTDIDELNKTMKFICYSNLYVKGQDFISILKFNKLFNGLYNNAQPNIETDQDLK